MVLVVTDFDGTIVRGDCGVHFARWAVATGFLEGFRSLRGLRRSAAMLGHAAALGTREVVLKSRGRGDLPRREVIRRAYASVAGFPADDARERMRVFAARILPRLVRRPVLDRLRSHAASGDDVVILSTGPDPIIRPFAEAIGLRVSIVACELVDANGALTGEFKGPMDGLDKAMRVRAIARHGGHALKQAWAYADHHDDLPVLEAVGRPVIVAPTRALRRVALQRGWEFFR